MRFYGDEAERHFLRNGKRYYFFCLAMISISFDRRQKIDAKVQHIEQLISRSSEGKVSRLHAKEIMDHRNWAREFSPAFRMRFIRRVCEIISTGRATKFVVAGCAEWETINDQKTVRDQVFSAAYIFALETCRAKGFVPIMNFDRVKNNKKNGWAEECVLGIQYYPLFVWSARQAYIPPISFVDPCSTLESKLADVLAFVTARQFAMRVEGRETEVPTELYGKAWHAGYNGQGDLVYRAQEGFPFKEVFGI